MKHPELNQALAAGYGRLGAWSRLLDQINVFPVADGDTGRNLRISLAPLYQFSGNFEDLSRRLLMAATGNSGNIAAAFFSGFLSVDGHQGFTRGFHRAADRGYRQARQVIMDPQPGTMLTLLEQLAAFCRDHPQINPADPRLREHLVETVRKTPGQLPVLHAAGVVDSGALGMFIFLEGFLARFSRRAQPLPAITETFRGQLEVRRRPPGPIPDAGPEGYCIDTVLEPSADSGPDLSELNQYGASVVARRDREQIKIHLHTRDPGALKAALQSMGQVSRWSQEVLEERIVPAGQPPTNAPVHIVTDGAGAITRTEAQRLGITLLDSYILWEDQARPETLVDPEELYALMGRGVRVSTAQASRYERHQHYQSLVKQHSSVVYLCVGAVYTGNHACATEWGQGLDSAQGWHVVDTGAASGRLGVIVRAAARFAGQAESARAVADYARKAAARSREYIFLDRLKYLVAGGRLSPAKGFFGDLLHRKPVISPTAEGVVKAGVVANRAGQVRFALARLKEELDPTVPMLILLQYSDNEKWVRNQLRPEFTDRFPATEILCQPLSLTSGAHMGPGTWGVAFGPDGSDPRNHER